MLVDPINMAAGSCKQWQCDSDGMNQFQDPVAAGIPFILNFSEQDIASLNKILLSCSSFNDWIVCMKRSRWTDWKYKVKKKVYYYFIIYYYFKLTRYIVPTVGDLGIF